MNDSPPFNRKKYVEFYNSLGKNYPEEDVVYKSLRGLLRKKFVVEYLKYLQGSLLDIGCNKGIYVKHYKNGYIFGLDISKEILFKAQKELMNEHAGTYSLVAGDAENLGLFRENSFDNIIFIETLEHLPDPGCAISETFRVLKSNGKILITTPNYGKKKPYWQTLGLLKNYVREGIIRDKYIHTAFKPGELTGLLEKNGFTVIKSGTIEKEIKIAGKIPGVLYRIISSLNRWCFKSEKIEKLNYITFEKLSVNFYNLLILLRLDEFCNRLIKEGVRSFAVAQKPVLVCSFTINTIVTLFFQIFLNNP